MLRLAPADAVSTRQELEKEMGREHTDLTRLAQAIDDGETMSLSTQDIRKARRFLQEASARAESKLHRVAWAGDTRALDSLICCGVNVNAKAAEYGTALHMAAMQGHALCVDALVQAKADLNAQTETSCTALHWATLGNHPLIVQALLDAGARPATVTFSVRD